MFLQPLWKCIGNEVELDSVLKESFEPCEDPRKTTLRIKRVVYYFVAISFKAGVRNADIRRIIAVGCKIHSAVVATSSPYGHSIRILLLRSISLTFTCVETSYISQLHLICLPTSNLPLLLVNQNLVVISGLIKASNTSATGFRMSISAFAIGAFVKWKSVFISALG